MSAAVDLWTKAAGWRWAVKIAVACTFLAAIFPPSCSPSAQRTASPPPQAQLPATWGSAPPGAHGPGPQPGGLAGALGQSPTPAVGPAPVPAVTSVVPPKIKPSLSLDNVEIRSSAPSDSFATTQQRSR